MKLENKITTSPNPIENVRDPIEDARVLLLKDKELRLEQALKDLEEWSKKHSAVLKVNLELKGSTIVPTIYLDIE